MATPMHRNEYERLIIIRVKHPPPRYWIYGLTFKLKKSEAQSGLAFETIAERWVGYFFNSSSSFFSLRFLAGFRSFLICFSSSSICFSLPPLAAAFSFT